MAQRDTKSTSKESTAMKKRASPMKLQTSLSQPSPSNVTDQQKSNPHRHLTLPVSLNNNYPQSTAERYITSRLESFVSSNEQQDISPETPLSIASSIPRTNINSIQALMSHDERMYKWRQEEANKICKKQKHRYTYGPPPPSSRGIPTSLGSTFPPPMYLPPLTQFNLPLSSQRNNIQSSMPSTHTIKKDKLTGQSKTTESRHKIMFSAV